MEPSELIYQAFIISINGVAIDSRNHVLADQLKPLKGSNHYKPDKYL